MKKVNTVAGQFLIGNKEDIFNKTKFLIIKAVQKSSGRLVKIGLNGGSTPKFFFKWAKNEINQDLLHKCLWMVSDERCVPLNSLDSNFGNANRLFLEHFDIPKDNKKAWPVEGISPIKGVNQFNKDWDKKFGEYSGFDICFLGMGDDCHIASLFPQCPLIGQEKNNKKFDAIYWPNRGWRFTITENGLKYCNLIVVSILDKQKAFALYKTIYSKSNFKLRPAQILTKYAHKVLWLISEEVYEEFSSYTKDF